MLNELKITPEELVRCIVLSGDDETDKTLFACATRIGIGRFVVIGDSPNLRVLNERMELGLEFYPTDTVLPEESENFVVFKMKPETSKPTA